MFKKIFGALALALVAASSSAQFAPNQVLRAQDLNAALAAPTITGGSINGAPIGGTSPRAITATTVYAGTVTSPKFVGTITGVVTGTTTYATSAGTAAYAVSAGTATYSVRSGTATTAAYAVSAGTATVAATATAAGTATYATNAGNAYQLNGTTFAAPGPIGSTTPSTGAFSTVTVSGQAAFTTGTVAAPGIKIGSLQSGLSVSAGSLSVSIAGARQLQVTGDAATANFVEVRGGTAGNAALVLASNAASSNSQLSLSSKGASSLALLSDGGATNLAYFNGGLAAVNWFEFDASNSGTALGIRTAGSDADRSITVTPAGTGTVAVAGPLSVTGQASFAAGSAAAPSVKVGAGNDGLYSLGSTAPAVAANGLTSMRFGSSGTAANYPYVYSVSAGAAPVFTVLGSDADISPLFSSKGAGGIELWTGSATVRQVVVSHTASAVNYLEFRGSATGNPVTISTGGSDTNRSLSIAAAGTGTVRISGHQVVTGPTAPTVASGAGDCGTSPAIAGRDGAMRITVGSSTNGGVCTVTFGHAWATAPVCVASSESGIMAVRTTATTTTVAVAATLLSPADKLTVICMGY